MNVKLTIKSIIRYEQLTNKSFNQFDLTDSTELINLLYCVCLVNNEQQYTYDEFLKVLETSKKISKEIITKFNKQLTVIEQFSKYNNTNTKETQKETTENKDIIYIKDIAALLIVQGGISADYVMNIMEVSEIPVFMAAFDSKVKQELETKRLFTWLSILPQLSDTKKLDKPVKLYPFPWETLEDEEVEIKNKIVSQTDQFKNLMAKTIKL